MDDKQFDILINMLSEIHMTILAAETHRMGMGSDEDYKKLLSGVMGNALAAGMARILKSQMGDNIKKEDLQ